MFAAKVTDIHNIALIFFPEVLGSGSSGSVATDKTSSRIASRIGIIIAQAAVFEIHMESNAVDSMNPRRRSLGEVPTMLST